MKYTVNKCICNNISFKDLKEIAVCNNVKNIEELCSFVTVAANCKLCAPYIIKMLESGKTGFEIEENCR